MQEDIPPPSRTYTRVAHVYDSILTALQGQAGRWMCLALESTPGRNRASKQVRLLRAMRDRGYPVATLTDENHIWVKSAGTAS